MANWKMYFRRFASESSQSYSECEQEFSNDESFFRVYDDPKWGSWFYSITDILRDKVTVYSSMGYSTRYSHEKQDPRGSLKNIEQFRAINYQI